MFINYINKIIDNSGWSAFDVARTVLDEQIVVDAIIVGGTDSDHVNLRSLAHCSGNFYNFFKIIILYWY